MSKEPIVSFVVPVYKTKPEVFKKCLQHLFDQSLKDYEVICVFDGADEPLEQIAASFPRTKRLVIEHGGASKARNAGLAAATGKYVTFYDSDCYIKPDHAKRAVDEFEATGADFVYSDYELTGERGGFTAEPFDAYALTCGNYVSSMGFIRRDKAPKWDETLKAGQDWDFWWTAAESGCKGAYIPGAGFQTEPSDKDSISANGLSSPNRVNVINQVREKHGVVGRDIGVFTMGQRGLALRVAQVLGGDFIKPTGLEPTAYKTIFNIDYNFMSRFDGIASNVTKIQYWLPGYIEALKQARYQSVMETIRIAKGVINLCGTQHEKNALDEFGIQADVVPLPLSEKDFSETADTLPEAFSALVLADDNYGKLFQEIQQDLPHIKFGFKQGEIKDYSCLISFYAFPALDEAILNAHVNGRNVISNVQAPFCGFVDAAQGYEAFKKDLYQAIREVRGKPFNKEAKDYYIQLSSPVKFKEKVLGYSKPALEVVG